MEVWTSKCNHVNVVSINQIIIDYPMCKEADSAYEAKIIKLYCMKLTNKNSLRAKIIKLY